MKLGVYLDNDVVSEKMRRECAATDLRAIDQLYEWGASGRISLGGSRHSLREMERAPPHHQPRLMDGLTGLELAKDDHKVLGSYTTTDRLGGCTSIPLVTDIVNEPLYSALFSFGIKVDDAKHLMYAIHNGFDYFVTRDKGILNRRAQVEALSASIRVRKPADAVDELRKIDAEADPSCRSLRG